MNVTHPEQISVYNSAVQGDDDASLLNRCIEGDRIAFDRLVMKYRNQILNLCVRLLGNYSDGEDAAQDVFVNAYTHIKTFRGDSQVGTWLYRIALNTCRNRHNSWWGKLQKKVLRIGHSDSNADDPQFDLPDINEAVDERIDRRRFKAKITAAIVSLPVNFRELVVLRDIQEKSYEEISGITGLPSGTVKSRLARARNALQKKLKGVTDDK